MKIVVLDGYTENPGDLSWNSIRKFGEVEIYDRTAYEDSPLIVERIGDAEIVIVNKTPITKDTINKCQNIKLIAVLATARILQPNSFLQIPCQMHQNCKCCLRCSFTPQNPLSQPHWIKSSYLCCFCLLRVKSTLAANPQGNLFFSSQWHF